MTVPFLDLRAAYLELKEELDDAYQRVMQSGWYILGEEVERLEAEFAASCGAEYCIGVGSGLDALHLSLRALGIGPGAEVIVPSHTYIATWLAVSQVGASPVPAEPDARTLLRVKLRHLDDWNDRRKALAAQYFAGLADSGLALPGVPDWAEPVWHLFVVRHPRRDALRLRLGQAGIGTLIHYPIPPHRLPAYADAGFGADALPLASRLADEVLSLPLGPQLSEAQAARVIDAVRAALP